MASQDLALFRAWPRLRERLARHPFIDAPTPVVPLTLDGFSPGQLYVKRDERSCRLYGGNKPRKLEFLIGRALERGARRIVTSGAIGSHHGLATTVLGHAAGLQTSLVLVPQPVTPEVQVTLALDSAFGAHVVRAPGVATAVIVSAGLLIRSFLRGEAPYLIWTGGSSARGNLGFVSAGLELAEQVRSGVLPTPAEIFVPVGTGGTFAGLVLGLELAGLHVRVRGILATDILPPSPRRLVRAANASLALLRSLEPEIRAPSIGPGHFPLDRSELGAGYGAITPAARDACAAAAEQGVALETTYTGKCLAALQARARSGDLPAGPVLFWNTHSSVRPSVPETEVSSSTVTAAC